MERQGISYCWGPNNCLCDIILIFNMSKVSITYVKIPLGRVWIHILSLGMGKIAGLLSGKIIVIPTKIVNAIFTCKKNSYNPKYNSALNNLQWVDKLAKTNKQTNNQSINHRFQSIACSLVFFTIMFLPSERWTVFSYLFCNVNANCFKISS